MGWDKCALNFSCHVDLKEIRLLIDLMKKNGIAVFKMEREGFSITLKTAEANSPQAIAFSTLPHQSSGPLSASTTPGATAAEVVRTAPEADLKEIVSPMVGTFYTASSPEAAPFVEVGKQVTPDTVVCIIEAMKVMNEIKAEISGTIAEINAQNGKPVQFGQTLFRVK